MFPEGRENVTLRKKRGAHSSVMEDKEEQENPFGILNELSRWQQQLIRRSDIEPVDPKACIEESCKSSCVKPLFQYQACVKRVESDETGHKHCTGQYFDYWACVDNCAAPKVFSSLK